MGRIGIKPSKRPRAALRHALYPMVAALIAMVPVSQTAAAPSAKEMIEDAFQAGEAKLRPKLPIKQGRVTLTGIEHDGQRQFYNYSIDMTASPSTRQEFEAATAPAMIARVCAVEESHQLSNLGATLTFNFFDPTGKTFAQVNVAPGACK